MSIWLLVIGCVGFFFSAVFTAKLTPRRRVLSLMWLAVAIGAMGWLCATFA